MLIAGFQKTTLLDYPNHLASIIFTSGCNMRCPYCHNASLVLAPNDCDFFSEDEIISHIIKRKGMIEGLVISGGEPTLQKDLIEFIEKIKALNVLVKLDTNGSNPSVLDELLQKNLLDYVAMDIKQSKQNYETIARSNISSDNISNSLTTLKNYNIPYELRTTITDEHFCENDITDIAKWITGHPHWYLQPYKDNEETISGHFHAPDENTMEKYKQIANQYLPTDIRG